MKKTLYENTFSFYPVYNTFSEGKVTSTIAIILNISLWGGIWFTVAVPNQSFNGFNIFKLLLQALESQTVGKEKYTLLKTRVRKLGFWRQL